jgi:hypothetical protein
MLSLSNIYDLSRARARRVAGRRVRRAVRRAVGGWATSHDRIWTIGELHVHVVFHTMHVLLCTCACAPPPRRPSAAPCAHPSCHQFCLRLTVGLCVHRSSHHPCRPPERTMEGPIDPRGIVASLARSGLAPRVPRPAALDFFPSIRASGRGGWMRKEGCEKKCYSVKWCQWWYEWYGLGTA